LGFDCIAPTSEAFAPIRDIKQQIYLIAIFILIPLAVLAWWLMHKQLGVVTVATRSLHKMAKGEQSIVPLPVPAQRDDELGNMLHAFNLLHSKLEEIEQQIRQSKERFQNLFIHMSNGFALHQMVDDSNGNACDYIFLEVNPAFEKLTGLAGKNIVGKRAREVLPTLEQHWIDKYASVANSGRAIVFEDYAKPLEKWYRVTAYCPLHGNFAVIIEDVTELKNAQSELRHLAYHDVLTGLANRVPFF